VEVGIMSPPPTASREREREVGEGGECVCLYVCACVRACGVCACLSVCLSVCLSWCVCNVSPPPAAYTIEPMNLQTLPPLVSDNPLHGIRWLSRPQGTHTGTLARARASVRACAHTHC
jgi:hypothetical protein